MNEIKFTPGTVYDVAHLRPFDLALALQGHPLATYDGDAVRLFRWRSRLHYAWDAWSECTSSWDFALGPKESAQTDLRLAPLAIKDGRALHVGDEIEHKGRHWEDWVSDKVKHEWFLHSLNTDASFKWRWPEGEK